MQSVNASNSDSNGSPSSQPAKVDPADVLLKIEAYTQNGNIFYVPFIKLIGYGRKQTYQCVCCKCKDLYFNLEKIRDVSDLFCSFCQPSPNLLHPDNISPSNFVGMIIGWEIKLAWESKERSRFNYKKVYKRDGYQCQYCNYSLKNSDEFRPLHIDHIKPWTAGGGNTMDNLIVACSKCNLHASNSWFHSFWEKKKYINQFIPEMQIKIGSYETI